MSVNPNKLNVLHMVVPPVTQIFAYGIYTTLFCRCIYVFSKRRLSRSHKIFLTGTVLLFLICTIQSAFRSIPTALLLSHTVISINLASRGLYIVNNLIADILFIYRCYIIWGREKVILYVPLVLTIANSGMGLFSMMNTALPVGKGAHLHQAYLVLSLVMNVGLTLISAGHIWWISQEIRLLGPHVARKYNFAMALIIESGALYCIAMLAYVISSTFVVGSTEDSVKTVIADVFFGVLTQIVGIVPTLIVVRIGLGTSAEDVQTVILASKLKFHHEESDMEVVSNRQTIMSSHDFRHTMIIGSDEEANRV